MTPSPTPSACHKRPRRAGLLLLVLVATEAVRPDPASAQAPDLPGHLRDRGTGISTSHFATYVARGQLLVYPYVAYSRDNNREYQPAKLGFGLSQDFRGRFRSSEALLFVAYGVTDWLALEFEAAYLEATLDRSPGDPSAMPARIRESGVGDIEGQLRFRLLTERGSRPEFFGFVEMTPRSQGKKVLIGEPDWDLKPGFGVLRGYSWGTLMLRVAAEWNREASSPDLGEVTIEYLKRLSPSLRLSATLEGGETGAPDEFELITGISWRLAPHLFLKVDNGLGISSKATDWSPQVGAMFSFP